MNKLYFSIIGCLLLVGLKAQCPQPQNCPGSTEQWCDFTPNDNLLWNAPVFSDPLTLHDLAETGQNLSFFVVDTCPLASPHISYELRLDLNGDGLRETAVWSDSLPGYGTVRYGNALTPYYNGGASAAFDNRPVASNLLYGFALQTVTVGDTVRAYVRWNNAFSPSTYVNAQLPLGNHEIRWYWESGGVKDTCSYAIQVRDCAQPIVVAINGISANIMPTGMITLWASDFLQYTTDNITPDNNLKIGVRKAGTGTGFPVNGNGDPIISVTWNCQELGTQQVELWSIDWTGNAAFATTYVIIQDNLGNCNGGVDPQISGCCTTEIQQPMPWVEMVISGIGNTTPIPPFTYNTITNGNGCLDATLPQVPIGANVTITPIKDDNPLNGVTTFDLVLISRHIIGIAPLNSPYKLVAADVNKSGTITSFDIVELRKLILGYYNELPNNTSWRFVAKDYVFPNPSNPFMQPFPEIKVISNITSSMLDADFIGIKIGDVNNTAFPFAGIAAERGVPALLDLPDITLKEGAIADLPLSVPAGADWSGLQFSLAFDMDGLEVLSVTPGELPGLTTDNFHLLPGELRCVWAEGAGAALRPGAVPATLRVRARTQVHTRDVFYLNENALEAAAYAGETTLKHPLSLAFGKQPAIADSDISVWPNPSRSAVHWTVRDNQEASTLVIYDVSGKKLLSRDFLGNTTVEEIIFPASGVYFWEIETAGKRYSGKIIR